jgi:hypothetical protein
MLRKRRTNSRAKPSSSSLLLASIDSKLEKMGPKLLRELRIAEMERDEAVKNLKYLNEKLTNFLTPDQVDAALTCGISTSDYAINFIDLWREKILKDCAIEANVTSLQVLKHPPWRSA